MYQLKNGEKMYLNTLEKNDMYKSVSEIVGTDIETVKKFVRENADEIVACHYNEDGIHQMDLSQLLKGKEIKQISSLTVNHITPRENVKAIWDEGLLTLSHALTQKTTLSDYLKNIGLTFMFEKGQIVMYKDKHRVDVKGENGNSLKMRLGGEKTSNDYNINGYLFVDEFEEDAIRGWLGSPEFLKSLANYYGKYSIADNYADKCDNYYVSFEVPLDVIDLEGFSDEIDLLEKTELLLRYTINALAYMEMRRKPFLPMHNPIIFLKRNYDVPKENIRKIWKLSNKTPKWIPVDREMKSNPISSEEYERLRETNAKFEQLNNEIRKYLSNLDVPE